MAAPCDKCGNRLTPSEPPTIRDGLYLCERCANQKLVGGSSSNSVYAGLDLPIKDKVLFDIVDITLSNSFEGFQGPFQGLHEKCNPHNELIKTKLAEYRMSSVALATWFKEDDSIGLVAIILYDVSGKTEDRWFLLCPRGGLFQTSAGFSVYYLIEKLTKLGLKVK